jgi:hypothetical protein
MPSQRSQQETHTPEEPVTWTLVFAQDLDGTIQMTFHSTLTGVTKVLRTNPGVVTWGLPDTSRKLTGMVCGALQQQVFSVVDAHWEPDGS